MKNKNTSLLFASYQARKTKAEKTAFIQHACSAASDAGFMSNVENTKNGARNVVVGDVNSAAIVYTAHYDTPSKSMLPSYIFPKLPILTTLYQIFVALLILVPTAAAFVLPVIILPGTGLALSLSVLAGIVLAAGVFTALICLLLCGRSCPNNANSNTSGVAALFEIMANMPSEYRSKVAFVFFDGATNGLLGSSDFSKTHKHLGKKLFLNFDCIGVGENFVLAFRSGAAKYISAVEKAFPSMGKIKTEIISGAKRIPSDHNNFKCGIGVSAFEKNGGILHLTIKNNGTDTMYSEENIAYAASAAINVAKFVLVPDAISTSKFEQYVKADVALKVEASKVNEPAAKAPVEDKAADNPNKEKAPADEVKEAPAEEQKAETESPAAEEQTEETVETK